jgi:hypothetical protein
MPRAMRFKGVEHRKLGDSEVVRRRMTEGGYPVGDRSGRKQPESAKLEDRIPHRARQAVDAGYTGLNHVGG